MLTLFGEEAVCTKGWTDRCSHAKSGKCTCACGGANHGSKRFMNTKTHTEEKAIVKQKASFFLTKKTRTSECRLGEEVVVLADFSGVPAGTHGHIVEIYTLGKGKNEHRGVMVQWVKSEEAWKKPLSDGFGEDELEYLAFGTPKHPKVMKN